MSAINISCRISASASIQFDLLTPTALTVMAEHEALFTDKFRGWLPDNLHVYEAFEAEALKLIRRGFKHYSARTILQVLRHHSATAENSSEGWKLDNDHCPYLARLFDLMNPAHVGLWEYRETKATKVAA